jgi:hypothetical protein
MEELLGVTALQMRELISSRHFGEVPLPPPDDPPEYWEESSNTPMSSKTVKFARFI